MLHKATPCDRHQCHPGGIRRTPGWLRQRRCTGTAWIVAARCAGLVVTWLLIVGCGMSTGGPESDGPEPSAPIFNATAEGDGNTVNISTSGDTVVVDVHSSSGIGAATVDLLSGPAPAQIIVRLHLHGLESFRLLFAQTIIAAEVSSGDQRGISQHVELADGTTRPIASDNPLWLDIQIDSTPTSLAPSPQPNSFAIRMPHGLVNEQQRAFTMRWIDFYR